jgi:hypothetical protein
MTKFDWDKDRLRRQRQTGVLTWQPMFPSGYAGQQILTAKDGRKYFLQGNKAIFLKGSQPTK